MLIVVHKLIYLCSQENTHTHPKEGYWKFQGGGGPGSLIFKVKLHYFIHVHIYIYVYMNQNWNVQRGAEGCVGGGGGGRVKPNIPPWEGYGYCLEQYINTFKHFHTRLRGHQMSYVHVACTHRCKAYSTCMSYMHIDLYCV